MTRLIEMVVAKGRSVDHDGKTYGQHSRIYLPPNEAIRLEDMGFVLAVSEVRNMLTDPDSAGQSSNTGDGSGADDDDSAGGGAGAAGGGSADDGAGAVAGAGQKTNNAAAKNATGKNAKTSGA